MEGNTCVSFFHISLSLDLHPASPLYVHSPPLLFFLVLDYLAQFFFFFKGKQTIKHVLTPLISIRVRARGGGGEVVDVLTFI